MKSIKVIILAGLLLLTAILSGCQNNIITDISDDSQSSQSSDIAENETPTLHRFFFQTLFPASIMQIDMQTGDLLTLCPDPACTHDSRTPTCIYNNISFVLYACDGDGYVLFSASEFHNNKNYLYLYNRETKTVKQLRAFDDVSPYIVYGGGKFFFAELMEEDEITDENTVKIIMLDPVTEKETSIARVTKNETVFDYFKGYLITRVNFSQFFNRISIREPYEKDALLTPDGENQFSLGLNVCFPGYICVRHFKPSYVYLYDKSEYLKMPVDCQITSVHRIGETVVFQTVTSDPKFVWTGGDESENEGEGTYAKIYIFDPVVYFVNENGSYETYEIETDYMLSIQNIYGHKILATSDTVIQDGEPIIDQPEKYFWIDLDTGETVIYDFNFYSFNKTISTEKMTLKVTKVH